MKRFIQERWPWLEEALLIFFGKATIYLKGMNKPVPESIKNTIG